MGKILSAIVVYASAAAGEVHVLTVLLRGSQYFVTALMIHCLVISVLLGWLFILRRRRLDKRAAAIFLTSTAALGPIGYVGACVSIVAWKMAAHSSADRLDAYYASLFGSDEDAVEQTYKNLISGRENPGQYMTTQVVNDVLRWGTLEEKYKALSGLARNFRPEFAPSLRFALASAEPTVRIQAASMVAKIEKEFTQRWLALRQQLEDDPTNTAIRLELAQHLDSYAHTGMLDRQREQEVRKQAAELFRGLLGANDSSNDARLALGRLLTRLEEYEAAIACLAPLIEDPRAVSWYCQSLYNLGRFDEIRELAHRNNRHANVSASEDRGAGVQQLWSGLSHTPVLAIAAPQVSS